MNKPTIRMPWVRERVYSPMGDNPVVTDSSQGNDTDVNRIVARFARTGEMPVATQPCQYGDVTGLQEDLTTIIQRGKDAQQELAEMQKQNQEQQAAQAAADREELQRLRKQTAPSGGAEASEQPEPTPN